MTMSASHTSLESAASNTSSTPLSSFQAIIKDTNVNDDVRKGCVYILDTIKKFEQELNERFDHLSENFAKDLKLSK